MTTTGYIISPQTRTAHSQCVHRGYTRFVGGPPSPATLARDSVRSVQVFLCDLYWTAYRNPNEQRWVRIGEG